MGNIDIKPVNATSTAIYMLRHEDLMEFAAEIIRKYRETEAQAVEQEKETEGEKVAQKWEEEYLTRDEVMAITKRCGSTLTNWANAGLLKPIRLGCKYLYKKSDVIKLMSYAQ